MIKNVLAMLGAAMVLDKVSPGPLDTIATALEKLAWGLEELADILESTMCLPEEQGEQK